MAAMAVTAALTGCGGGGDKGDAAGEGAPASAAAAGKTVKPELTVGAVRSDFREAVSAAGTGRLQFVDMGDSVHPCRVYGMSQAEDSLEPKAVEPIRNTLKEQGWQETGELPVEEPDAFGWVLKKNQWQLFLAAGDTPEGSWIIFDANGEACGVPLPSHPPASETAPPERPTPPALR
ncbi:hypothetical protein [Streptomyces antibioticus]|uniref:hypothetical protein n=1 Tax=Streptomyces antibioticus TaxID=1890 RepID=UPI0036D9A309